MRSTASHEHQPSSWLQQEAPQPVDLASERNVLRVFRGRRVSAGSRPSTQCETTSCDLYLSFDIGAPSHTADLKPSSRRKLRHPDRWVFLRRRADFEGEAKRKHEAAQVSPCEFSRKTA